jgi:NADH dehydrogenase FAD-containing subunit
MLRTNGDLARSERVLIAGAGAVGVELAAEIKLAWPQKSVVVVDGAPGVVGARPHSDRLRSELRGQLDALGVELRLGAPLVGLPEVVPARHGDVRAVTAAGDRLTADIWFRCFGLEPASEPLRGALAAARRADGSVEVDEFLRVKGQDRVYALGDVSSADAKMAGLAMIQAAIVVSNIKAHLRGEPPGKRYRPIGPMIMVAIGPDGGAGESPAGFHHPDEVSAVKSRDLLTGYFRDLLGLDPIPAAAD